MHRKRTATKKKYVQKKAEAVHFIGIGGIGMSSLAQYFLSQGVFVSGSDLSESDTIAMLREKGAEIVTRVHAAQNIPARATRVIVSNAIDKKNSEYRAAKKRGLRIRTYAEAVGELSKKYTMIAVCGSHGKSTTTALLALVLEKAGLDPTVIVGTKLHEWHEGNFRKGSGPHLVLEADEYKGAFLKYAPKVIIATNIDREHLDYYKTFERVVAAFEKFFAKLPKDGLLILNKDDAHLHEIGTRMKKEGRNVAWYSHASGAREAVAEILRIPGAHNVLNALAVSVAAKHLKIPEETVLGVLGNYKGSWRRAEYKGTMFGAKVFDDYAHHPTEINATLSGFREKFPMSRIWCVFRPHQEKRLDGLFDEFAGAFRYADRIVLLDTYRVPGRDHAADTSKKTVSAENDGRRTAYDLARAIDSATKRSVFYLPYESEIAEFLKGNVFENDIIIMMGAGNINEMTKRFLQSAVA